MKKALDIGCGDGKISLGLAMAGFKVIAVDKDKKKLAKLKGEDNIETIHKDIRDYRIRKKFDLIISRYSLNFIPRPNFIKLIKDIYNSLQQDGIFYLFIFTKDDPMAKKWDSDRFYTRKEIKSLFKEIRFKYKIRERKFEDSHPDRHIHRTLTIRATK